jgi:hypothetical protein
MRRISRLARAGAIWASVAAIPVVAFLLAFKVEITELLRNHAPWIADLPTTEAQSDERVKSTLVGESVAAQRQGERVDRPLANVDTSLALIKTADDKQVLDHKAPEPARELPRDAGSGVARPSSWSENAAEFPDDAESRIWKVLSELQHLDFTSIDRVACTRTMCEIWFTGGPAEISSALMGPLSKELPMIRSGWSSAYVEFVPGTLSSVFVIRNWIGNDLPREYPMRDLKQIQ